ncbi:hypothetical protein [Enterocloster sp.]|uniref:hypothetical protein n=1 Tax=Enterocloster sp. TaxID=2719315 RepID=UPI0039A3EEF2
MKKSDCSVLTMAMAAGMMTGCGGSGKPARAWWQQPQRMRETRRRQRQRRQRQRRPGRRSGGGGAGAHRRCNAYKDLQRWNQTAPT